MKNRTTIAFALVVSAIALVAPLGHAGQPPANRELIAESSILAGLAPNALFPFVDSTPHHIGRAHIAITDATATCEAGAAAPSKVQILAGEAGVELVNVMTAATNTGIGSAAQCVFHVTIKPGQDGVPEEVTDIVVVNANPNSPLTGVNTITVSALVK